MTDETSNISGSSDGDIDDRPNFDELDPTELTPEQEAKIAEAQQNLDDVRARLAEIPAEVVVTNHAMGLYELAAIHLSSPTPDFAQATLAIDALGYLVDGLGDRLGEEAATLRHSLHSIRLVFIRLQGDTATEAQNSVQS